jgi:hypothetical protein
MSDLVRYKKPANMPARPVQRLPATIYGQTRREVMAELGRRQKARSVASTGTLRLLTMGPRAGWYALPIEIIAAPVRSPWRKRAIVASWVGGTAAGLFGLGWWSVATLGAIPLAALLVGILVALVLLVRATSGSGSSSSGGGITVTTTTTVNIR